jgi:hypothetical protein
MQGRLDDLSFAAIDGPVCIRQVAGIDENECIALRNYLEKFPEGHHRQEARAVLDASEPARRLRERRERIEECERFYRAPPFDSSRETFAWWAAILGRPC